MMLRTTHHADGRTFEFAIIESNGNVAGLYVRTAVGLWMPLSTWHSVQDCIEDAEREYAVDVRSWRDEPTTPNDIMQMFAQDAVSYANKEYGIRLDLSEESLKQVEAMLDAVWQKRPRGLLAKLKKDVPQEQLQSLCKIFGAYVGEVMRRHMGGEWRTTGRTDGWPFYLEVGNSTVWPPTKVMKRLTNGPEDNVYHYYRVVTQHGA